MYQHAASQGPPQQAGDGAALPGYYTAYWAQQQQQHQQQHSSQTASASAAAASYPNPAAYPPYPQHATPAPSAYPTTAPPPSSAPSAAGAPATGTLPADAAAAYAKYQEDYACWYNQYYLPYATHQAQSTAPYPQHAPLTSATYPHAAPPTQPPPPAAHPPQVSPNLSAYGYPQQPTAASHAQHSQTYSSSPHPSPPTAAQHTASPHTLPQADVSKRSRWGAVDESAVHRPPPSAQPFAHHAPPAADAPSPSSSSSAVVWPPAVFEYVKRSLGQCPADQRVKVEAWLRERLQAAVINGSINSTDWDREPAAHVRKLAEDLTKRHSRAPTAHTNAIPHTVMHEAEERNVDEERREWEERRRREEEQAEASRRKRPYFHEDRPTLPRNAKKRLRDDDEKSFDYNHSSSDEDDDIQHFLSSSYNNKQLSKRELKKQQQNKQHHKTKTKQTQQQSSNNNNKPPIWQHNHIDDQRNQHRANRFAEYVQQAAATPVRTQIRTDLFKFSTSSSSSSSSSAAYGGDDDDDVDWSALKIVGTSTSLEKSYFRLTSPPTAEVVRPPAVLTAALERLLLIRAAGERTYAYLCDQMKAIRQDLTVQGVKGAVAVRVYEEHARMAIEVGDMSEYNQCQTQLMVLYADKPSSAVANETEHSARVEGNHEEKDVTTNGRHDEGVWENETEFVMYRLCYYLLVNNQPAIASYLRSLTPTQLSLPTLQLLLQLRSAVATDDFYTFLNRYHQTPYMAPRLLQHLCPRMRWMGVQVLVRGFKPTRVEVEMFVGALGFGVERDECVEFLVGCGVVLSDDKQFVLTASSELHEPEVKEDVEDEADKHNVTHALLSSIRRKQ